MKKKAIDKKQKGIWITNGRTGSVSEFIPLTDKEIEFIKNHKSLINLQEI